MELTKANLISELRKEVPDFNQSYPSQADHFTGAVLGAFASYLNGMLVNHKTRPFLLQKAVNFVNHIAESQDAGVQELLRTELFVGLYDLNPKSIGFLKTYLSQPALSHMEAAVGHWGNAA